MKQRELESRGVSVEKALRGEGGTYNTFTFTIINACVYSLYLNKCISDSTDREEADLLREWFDLMKERTELRRYEKELLVRAQEVQLEDRHERLQQELRERLADDGKYNINTFSSSCDHAIINLIFTIIIINRKYMKEVPCEKNLYLY